MSRARVFAARLAGLFRRRRRERDLADEVRFHLDMQIDDNRRAGMPPDQARRQALRHFGGIEPMKERYRQRRAVALIETTLQDVRYALRALRRSPSYSATAVSTLALAIGASTLMFSVLNGIVLRPLPYRDADRLVMVWREQPTQNLRHGRSTFQTAEIWRRAESLSDLAILDPVSAAIAVAGNTEQASLARISANLFPLLGVRAAHGRVFSEDDARGRQRVAVISHALWQRRFGGVEGVVGASIDVDGRTSTVVGVLPPDLAVPLAGADVWEPATLFPDWDARMAAVGPGSWFVIARLTPGTTLERAQAELAAIATTNEQIPTSDRRQGVSVTRLALEAVDPTTRLAVWMLTTAAFGLLLIAATNVASLSLARATMRQREMSVRAALGATRTRIARQLLVESLSMATLAGAIGLSLALAGVQAIRTLQPAGLPRLDDVELDWNVVAWAIGLALLCTALIGLMPALTATRRGARPLRDQERGNTGSASARRARQIFVVAEFAMAIVLLADGGLLVRSLWSIQHVETGFASRGVLAAQLAVPQLTSSGERTAAYERLVAQVAAAPSVVSVSIIGDFLVGGSAEQVVTAFTETGPRTAILRLRRDEIGRDFFDTVSAPLLKGRLFTAADGADAPPVAIVNQMMAERLWADHDPIGQRFTLGAPDAAVPPFTVVGVVGNLQRQGLDTEPIAQLFEPLAQNPSQHATLLIRTTLDDPTALSNTVRAAVRQVDARTSLYGLGTLDARMDARLAQRRLQTALLLGFATVAMLMAAVGIYGLLHYSVATRTREIGIRLAIGAEPGQIFRMTLFEGLTLSTTGLGAGLLAAMALGHLIAGLLFGVSANDPATLVGVSVLLTAIALVACYIPARRAMSIQPTLALRGE